MATNEIAERIQYIENNLILEPVLKSQVPKRLKMTELMELYRVSGVSIAVINNHQIEWSRGYGVRKARKPHPVIPETLFQAGSISKPVTAVTVLRLVEEGLLDLDEDVNKYLISWKIPSNGSWQPRITLRQLLSHTAGLNTGGSSGYPRDAELPTLVQILNGEKPAKHNWSRYGVRVVTIPSLQFSYSNPGYDAIQQLLIDVLSKPFPEIMRELVLDPLEMADSTFEQPLPRSKWDFAASGHIGGRSDTPIRGGWRIQPEMAAGGLWTTPSDLARFAIELIRSKADKSNKILSAEMVHEMMRPVDKRYGLGFVIGGDGESSHIYHDGASVGFVSQLIAFTERGQGAVFMTNSGDFGFEMIDAIEKAIARVYNWPDWVPKEQVSVEVHPHIYDAYVGKYEIRPNFHLTITQADDALRLQPAGQPSMELYPTSETQFFAKVVNAEVTFVRDEAGEVTALKLQQDGKETSAKRVGSAKKTQLP